jgi:hypothetical protein
MLGKNIYKNYRDEQRFIYFNSLYLFHPYKFSVSLFIFSLSAFILFES